MRRPPGREAYPGDIFYSPLAACWSGRPSSATSWGAGSLTASPIVETLEGEVSAYIPTNVISITDGPQSDLQPDLFFAGQASGHERGHSVSRVLGAAQVPAMKKVAGGLRLDLALLPRAAGSSPQLGTRPVPRHPGAPGPRFIV